MKVKVIYGKWSNGHVSVAHVEEREMSAYAAAELSKLAEVAAVAANETMKRRMVYVNGTLTQA